MNDKVLSDNRLYWICQVTGWLAFYFLYAGIALTIIYDGFNWFPIIAYFNSTLIGFFLTHLYRYLIKRQNWLSFSDRRLIFKVITACFIIGILWTALVLPINHSIKLNFFSANINIEHLSLGYWFLLAFQFSIIIFIWSLIYFIYKFFNNYKQAEIDKWRLNAAVKDAELMALKSQINPHFMFNCLNNIRSLVIENPEKARDMILHLSDLLRYSLHFSNKAKINLEDELEIVKNYLTLESIQYEDRLKYRLDIQDETLEMKIPPMAIQLLVENAIKHGISLLPKGGKININSYLENSSLVVEVINSGQIKNIDSPSGIGLKNAAERLNLVFGQLAQLKIENKDRENVKARFSVPVIY